MTDTAADISSESPLRTMLIAIAIALACSAMVSAAVLILRPVQSAYADLDRNRAILGAAGILPAGADDRAVVAAFLNLDARVVDLADGSFVGGMDGHAYDHWARTDETATRPAPSSAETIALPVLPRYVPVYFVAGAGGERLILPLHGQGMWSTLYAYLVLDADLATVRALGIHSHGETPGIGDRVDDPVWLGQWQGKSLYDAGGTVRLQVSRDQSIAPQFRVDAVSGATVTSEAVGRMVAFWAGPDGYQPLLERLRKQPPSDARAGGDS